MSEPDLSEFEELAKPPRKQCKIASSLEKLSDDDAAALKAALEESGIPPRAIVAWLERRGITDVHFNSIAYHRTADCRCSDE